MTDAAVLDHRPSVMLPTASAWLAAARERLRFHGFATDALHRVAADVLEWVEDACAPFGAEGFDWGADAGREAVDEYLKDGS